MSRIYLVDDHALVRDGMRAVLEASGHEVVGEENTSEQGWQQHYPAYGFPERDIVLAEYEKVATARRPVDKSSP